ncbi:unnamed protein product, partial [Laminaria digitata]
FREAFLRFFVALLSGYRRFLVFPTKANPNPARLFNVEDYLDKLERDSRPFAELLCSSQAFQNFVDARLQPETDDLDILFFDASITAKRNRSMRSFIKKDANFLRPETFVKAKTVYALTPDTSGIDMTAPPMTYDSGGGSSGFSFNFTFKHFGHTGGGGRKGEGGGGAENGGEDGRKKSSGLLSTGGRSLRMESLKGEDEGAPLSAEATVFAVFIIGFCATIGLDPPRRRQGSRLLPAR